MDVQKNPWKKGSLRPLSQKQKDDQQQKQSTKKDLNNGIPSIEITGTKIAKQSEIGLMKFTLNRTNKSQKSNKNEDQESEMEEEKWNSGKKGSYSQQQLMDETIYSETSNIYIDDQVENFNDNKPRDDFNNFMREKIENNPDKKKAYDNYLLEQKRREHEEELKKQTSKPFQVQKGRMSSSATTYSKQRSNVTTNEGLGSLHHERSTEFGSKTGTKSEIGDDFLVPSDFLGSRIEQQISVMGNELQNQQNAKIQNKPFKISDLKRNSSRTEQNQQEIPKPSQSQQVTKKPRQGLSLKEKKKLQEEEAILKKNSQNQQNQVWKVNDPALRQIEQQQKINKEKKKEQIEKIERSLIQMEKNMSTKNKLKVIALVNGNDNMEDLNENQLMTEYDIELAEKEAQVYEMERQERMQKLQDLMEESVDDLSKMSASEIRNRALFITEFAKNKSSMQQSFYSQMSKEQNEFNPKYLNEFNELEQTEEQKEIDDMKEEQSVQESINRNRDERFIKRNITNAFRSEIQQADQNIENFMAQEARDRLLSLISGCEDFDLKREEEKLISEGNPFGLNKEQQEELKTIQKNLEKIKMDENTIQQILGHELFSLKDAILPKDPALRDEAELKILREKMNSVNERLRDLFDIDKRKEVKSKIGCKVEKIKIQNLVSQLIEQQGDAEPTIEIENLLSDFEENQRLLDESRKIISELQNQDIEKEVGEYNQLLLEAISIQNQYEQMLDLNGQNALMEEQCEIINSFKQKFQEIYQIQKEIEQTEKKFVQELKDNNLADLLGIQFNENNDDYEVEDIKKIEQEEQEKLQREIQEQIDIINKKYEQLQETEIDQKLQEMYDQDAIITQKLAECNPTLLDDLRESVLHQMQEDDLQRSQTVGSKPYFYIEKDEQQGQEQDEDEDQSLSFDEEDNQQPNTYILKLENNYNESQIEETINLLEKRQREKEERERQQQQYFENMKQVKEHEQAFNQLMQEGTLKNNESSTEGTLRNTMLQDSLMQENPSEKNSNIQNEQVNETEEQQINFQDSLEM